MSKLKEALDDIREANSLLKKGMDSKEFLAAGDYLKSAIQELRKEKTEKCMGNIIHYLSKCSEDYKRKEIKEILFKEFFPELVKDKS